MILERMFVCMLEIWVFYDVIDKFKLINVDLIEYICFKVIVIFKIGMKIVNIKWIILEGGENCNFLLKYVVKLIVIVLNLCSIYVEIYILFIKYII